MTDVPDRLMKKIINMTNPTRLKIINPLRSGQATEQVVARVYELISIKISSLEIVCRQNGN